jgi:N-acetylmuramoyl-L-alanine amidase
MQVVFGGKPLLLDAPASQPFRDPVDNILCISPDMLAALGVIYIVDEKMGKVTFTNPEGTATTTVELRTPPDGFVQKGVFVPAIETVEGLGGKCEWDSATNTLYMRSVLQSVEMVNGKLVLRATLPITATVSRLPDEKKVLINVTGSEVGNLPKTLPLEIPGVTQVRTGQFESDTARIVLQLKDNNTYFSLETNRPSVVVALNPVVSARPRNAEAGNTRVVTVNRRENRPLTTVNTVTFRSISKDRAQFVVRAGRVPVARPVLSKGRLTLDLLNATLGPQVMATLGDVKHPFLKAVQMVARGNNAAQLILDLTRVVNFTVKPDNNGNLVLDITMPRNAGGTLAGKLIVVDPGHGGPDSGATGSGYREKHLALAISLKLADALRENGANVLLTRADDFFIPVSERPRIANRADADFFIAVHCDSGDSNRSINGSTVYYHAYDPNCRNLAQSIAQRLDGTGGIRSNGIRTDFVRFPGRPDGSTGGFGVLRGSRMVAVLVETGYMSNSRDVSRLADPGQQAQIAAAIAAGLRDYIEGNPNMDTRTNRPEAGDPPLPPLAEVPEEPMADDDASTEVPEDLPSSMPIPNNG